MTAIKEMNLEIMKLRLKVGELHKEIEALKVTIDIKEEIKEEKEMDCNIFQYDYKYAQERKKEIEEKLEELKAEYGEKKSEWMRRTTLFEQEIEMSNKIIKQMKINGRKRRQVWKAYKEKGKQIERELCL